MECIYLDNNATTALDKRVINSAKRLLEIYANPSSDNRQSLQIHNMINVTRSTIAKTINADFSEIFFTSGGTESIATAFFSALSEYSKVMIYSAVEHKAVLHNINRYKLLGYKAICINVDKQGNLNNQELVKCINNNPKSFISIMHANNETGVIFPIKQIISLAREKDCLIHVDAIQTFGKLKLNLKELDCDYLSLSLHKFHCLKGVGVLYVKNKSPLKPIFRGSQEFGKRGGTENTIGIISANDFLQEVNDRLEQNLIKIQFLRDKFEKEISDFYPEAMINGINTNRLYNTTSIILPGIKSELLKEILDSRNIIVSTGAACKNSGVHSHVLQAMHLEEDLIDSTLRVSFSKYNNLKDVEKTVLVIKKYINKMRG